MRHCWNLQDAAHIYYPFCITSFSIELQYNSFSCFLWLNCCNPVLYFSYSLFGIPYTISQYFCFFFLRLLLPVCVPTTLSLPTTKVWRVRFQMDMAPGLWSLCGQVVGLQGLLCYIWPLLDSSMSETVSPIVIRLKTRFFCYCCFCFFFCVWI